MADTQDELTEVQYVNEEHRRLFEETYEPSPSLVGARGMAAPDAPDEVPLIDDIGALPTFRINPTFRTHVALLGADPIEDGAGSTFSAVRFQDGNYTRVYVRKTARDGTLVGQWAGIGPYGWKIDGFGLTASGRDLVVEAVAHDLPPDPSNRESADGLGVIENVFEPLPGGALPKAGAAGAFIPQAPQEPQMDWDQLRNIIRAEVAAGVNELASRFGGNSIRQGIEQKVGDGLLYMNDPANYNREWKTKQFQDATFNRDMQRMYFALNKHIIGENPQLPVENQGFIDLIKQCVREVLTEMAEVTKAPEEPQGGK